MSTVIKETKIKATKKEIKGEFIKERCPICGRRLYQTPEDIRWCNDIISCGYLERN